MQERTCPHRHAPHTTHRRKVEPLGPDHLRPDLLGDTAHGLVQDEPHRLDRDVALLALGGGLAEGPEDAGGDEPAASDGDEEGGSWRGASAWSPGGATQQSVADCSLVVPLIGSLGETPGQRSAPS